MQIARFILISLLLAALMAGISWTLSQPLNMGFNWMAAIAAVAVCFLCTFLAFAIVYGGLKKKAGGFMGALVSGMFIKILLALASLLLVAMFWGGVVKEYAAALIISYIIFTAFEVYSLNRNLRAESSGSPETSQEAKPNESTQVTDS